MSLQVGSSSPWLVPIALAACGVLAAALAIARARRTARKEDGSESRGRRLSSLGMIALYALVALLAVAAASIEINERMQLFWKVDWRPDDGVLVLDRPLPLRDVSFPSGTLESVTEFAARERSVMGPRVVVRFVVRSTAGDEYWSAPVVEAESAIALRALFQTAGSGELGSVRIGGAGLR